MGNLVNCNIEGMCNTIIMTTGYVINDNICYPLGCVNVSNPLYSDDDYGASSLTNPGVYVKFDMIYLGTAIFGKLTPYTLDTVEYQGEDGCSGSAFQAVTCPRYKEKYLGGIYSTACPSSAKLYNFSASNPADAFNDESGCRLANYTIPVPDVISSSSFHFMAEIVVIVVVASIWTYLCYTITAKQDSKAEYTALQQMQGGPSPQQRSETELDDDDDGDEDIEMSDQTKKQQKKKIASPFTYQKPPKK